VERIVSEVKDIGVVDILVNNAGIFEPKAFADIPDENWERFFEVNVMSGVRFSRAFMPEMLLKSWGRIIFISLCSSQARSQARSTEPSFAPMAAWSSLLFERDFRVDKAKPANKHAAQCQMPML
jgi:NAD(P)-dependent dehydrogenase (short-subunit alcohol dehydrogenase family)